MLLPEEIVGLHRFSIKNEKPCLECANGTVVELGFINFLDHGGVLRAKFKSSKIINGRRVEIPLDIFIKEFTIQDLGFYITGEELYSKSRFSVNGEYRFWQKEFKISGSIRGKAINIANKDLINLIRALISEFDFI